MSSFDRLLAIYPTAYKDEERAQTFLWYHLRRYPKKKTAHIKTIQKYFRKADRPILSLDEIRKAFESIPQHFPPGTEPDTFGYAPLDREWHDRNFGSCFDKIGALERIKVRADGLHRDHPFFFWLFVAGAVASIIGLPLAFVLWWLR